MSGFVGLMMTLPIARDLSEHRHQCTAGSKHGVTGDPGSQEGDHDDDRSVHTLARENPRDGNRAGHGGQRSPPP